MTTVPKLLVPIDFSSGSDSSVAYATALAQTLRSVVTLFHVYERSDAMSSIVSGADRMVDDEHDRALAREWLEGLRRRTTTDRDVEVRVVVVSGSPAREIISFARKSSFDMIVMGTHGRTGLQHLLMGSVAEAVLRRASCPVLTIHCPFRTATAQVESQAVDSRPSR
jgi:nucleotide-binding universal stress UspA family protein